MKQATTPWLERRGEYWEAEEDLYACHHRTVKFWPAVHTAIQIRLRRVAPGTPGALGLQVIGKDRAKNIRHLDVLRAGGEVFAEGYLSVPSYEALGAAPGEELWLVVDTIQPEPLEE